MKPFIAVCGAITSRHMFVILQANSVKSPPPDSKGHPICKVLSPEILVVSQTPFTSEVSRELVMQLPALFCEGRKGTLAQFGFVHHSAQVGVPVEADQRWGIWTIGLISSTVRSSANHLCCALKTHMPFAATRTSKSFCSDSGQPATNSLARLNPSCIICNPHIDTGDLQSV